MKSVDLQLLKKDFAKMSGRTKYKLGAKSPLHDGALLVPVFIDCSGYTRLAIYRATGITIPDGSQNQLAWAKKNLRRVEYADAAKFAKSDPSRLFICFLSPKKGKAWPRHVWFLCTGKTLESCSSLGVGSRSWDVSVLKGCVDCFEVTG